jgi:hypothetical protein
VTKPRSSKEYENLGRTVAAIYESGYLDKKQMLKTSFLKGIVTGLGGVVGATVVVALLLWVLSFFESLGFLRPIIDTVRNTFDQK